MKTTIRAAFPIALLLTACGTAPSTQDAGDCATTQPRLFVSVSSYTEGTLCAFGRESSCVLACDGTGVNEDTLLARHGDRLVAINSGSSDSLSYFSIVNGIPSAPAEVRVSRLSGDPDRAANPRGYTVLPDGHGCVSRMFLTTLANVDPTTDPPTARVSTDLAPLAEGAQQLAPYRITRVDDKVWVSLLRLDNGNATFTVNGAIGIVDPSTEAIVDADPSRDGTQPIELPFGNPVGVLNVVSDARGNATRVRVACSGSLHDLNDGGLVEIDATPPYAVRTLLTETDLMQANQPGSIDAAIALDAHRTLLRLVSQEAPGNGSPIDHVSLVVFDDRSPGTVSAPWLTVHEWTLTEPVLTSDGVVYVGDRGDPTATPARPAGLRAFDAMTGSERTMGPVFIGSNARLDQPYAIIEAP